MWTIREVLYEEDNAQEKAQRRRIIAGGGKTLEKENGNMPSMAVYES